MQVVSSTPFRVATVLWQPVTGSFAFSVLCKATFSLRPGESALASDQEVLQKEDAFWGNDPSRSLSRASDLAPQKPRADVVLTGHAFAPRGTAVRSLTARLAVGDVDKSIEVFCKRHYDASGALRDGPPFTQMPLVYELAAAGADNPAGLRPGTRDAQGFVELPSLVAPGTRIDAIRPIGFGPVASTWPLRAEKLGRRASGWDPAKWYRAPLDGVDLAYFNSAPPDQQTASLQEDARIVLEGLHPDHAVLVTCLPGIRATASVELPGKAAFPLPLTADTLAINTAMMTATLVWRAHFAVDDPRVDGRVIIGIENGPAKLVTRGGADLLGETAVASGPLPGQPEQALPFQAGMPGASPSLPPSPPVSARPQRSGETMGIPVFPGTGAAQRTGSVSVEIAHAPGAPPFASTSGAGPLSGRSPAPASLATPSLATPPLTTPSLATPPLATPSLATPPLAAPPRVSEPPPDPAPVPLTIGQAMAAAQAAGPTERTPIASGQQKPEMLATTASATDPDAHVLAEVGAGGVLAASNAAAPAPADFFASSGPRAESATPRGPSFSGGAEVLRLSWFDLDGVPRMRRKPAFRALLDDLARRPPDRDADNARVDESPAEIEDRREVTEILLRGEPTGADGVRDAVNQGIRDDGRFVPQTVLLAGELEMAFDAVETLKAMLPVAASFAGAGPDDPLASAVAGASTFLNTPGFPSPLIADTLAGRVRNAFVQSRRGTKERAEALDGPAERVLVEQRLYRRRPVFGDTFVRASVILPGSPHAIPTYFPEAAVKKLPLHRRYRARLLVETHLAADPAESHPVALRAIALAEVLPGGKR